MVRRIRSFMRSSGLTDRRPLRAAVDEKQGEVQWPGAHVRQSRQGRRERGVPDRDAARNAAKPAQESAQLLPSAYSTTTSSGTARVCEQGHGLLEFVAVLDLTRMRARFTETFDGLAQWIEPRPEIGRLGSGRPARPGATPACLQLPRCALFAAVGGGRRSAAHSKSTDDDSQRGRAKMLNAGHAAMIRD